MTRRSRFPLVQPTPSGDGRQKTLPLVAAMVRACRVCGCTDNDYRGCIERTGAPCRWIAQDLCSACQPKREAA